MHRPSCFHRWRGTLGFPLTAALVAFVLTAISQLGVRAGSLGTPGSSVTTAPKPSLIQDLNTEGASSTPTNLAAVDGMLYFSADDGLHGHELWKSDGTPDGTILVKDLHPGPGSSDPEGFVGLAGKVSFATHDEMSASLWVSDGTLTGTVKLRSFPTRDALELSGIRIGASAYFVVHDDSIGGLWVTNGTPEGTMLVHRFPPGSLTAPSALTSFAGQVYFLAGETEATRGLWVSDGTPTGTALVKPLAGASSLVAGASELYLVADYELWKSDGTASGTVKLTAIPDGWIDRIIAMNGIFYLIVEGNSPGESLWRSDGTSAGTALITSFPPSGTYYAEVKELVSAGGQLYVLFYDSNDGSYTLWSSDGTSGGTIAIKRFVYASNLIAWNSRLFLSADNGQSGRELWMSDGTEAGTTMLADIRPGPSASSPEHLAVSVGGIIFSADDGVHGPEPWTSDGTAVGTTQLADLEPGPLGSAPDGFVASYPSIYFTAKVAPYGRELWGMAYTPAHTAYLPVAAR